MGTVTKICMLERPEFTWAEANALLPTVKRIFANHERIIGKALSDQRFYMSTGAPQRKVTECDNAIAEEMRQCGLKLHKLGLKVLGNGYVGFNGGVFYWSFHMHDQELDHYHAFGEDPIMRHKINILHPSYVQE